MNNNNLVVMIPKELKKIQSKLFFGLTKRQLIGFGSAGAIGGLMFFLFKDFTNVDVAMYIMFFCSAPIFFMTIYSKDGIPAEQWIKLIIEYKYIHPQKRKYRITVGNKNLAKKRMISFGKRKKRIKENKYNANVANTNRQ